MAENNLARNRNDGPDFFADGDPLAELARIVGFDEKPAPRPAPPISAEPAPAPRRDPVFNLEDELLREFEQYDTPRIDPVNDIPLDEPTHEAAPAVFDAPSFGSMPELDDTRSYVEQAEPEALTEWRGEGALAADPASTAYPSVEPVEFYEEPAPVEQVVPVQAFEEPARPVQVSPAQTYDAPAFFEAEPVVEAAQPQAPAASADFDLAAELENSFISEPQPASPAAPVIPVAPAIPVQSVETRRKDAYTPGFRMPLANFHLNGGVTPIPRTPAAEPVIAPQPMTDEAADAAAAQSVAAAALDWDLSFMKTDAASAPVNAEPVVPSPVSAPVQPVAFELPKPVAPDVSVSRAEKPSEKFSALDELIYDVGRFPVGGQVGGQAAPSIKPVTVSLSQPAPVAAVVAPAFTAPVVAAPIVAAPAAAAAAPKVADDPFDIDPFADEAFELALDDLELDLADIVGEENNRPQAKTFVEAPQPVRTVQATQAAAFTAPAAVFDAPSENVKSFAQPVAPVVSEEETAEQVVEDLPFDPSLIADSEESPEVIAELDVPALPAHEPEEEPPYTPEYDLDIDAELAALLVDPSNSASPAAREQAAAPVSAAARAAEPRKDAQPVQADLDDFEKALEEDFRRSLATPLPAAEYDADAGYAGEFEDESPRRSARAWVLPLAFVGAVALFGGGAYALLGGGMSRVVSGGEPVVIAADKDPIKVVPENPGGKTVPNQDKAVYDRVAGAAPQTPKQQSLISSDEQPVDVVQKTLMPENLPLEGENDIEPTDVGETQDPRLLPQQGQQQVAANGQQDPVTVAPRRVKTMIVRPDGKLVEQEVSAPAASPVPALASPSSEKMPAASVKAPELVAANAAPAAHTAAPASIQQTSASATDIMPVSTTTAEIQAPANASVAKAPVPTTRPSQQPVNVVAAVSDKGAVRAPAAAATPVATQPAAQAPAAPTQVASLGDGGYVIQIASLPSQADAQKSYQNLSSKFGGVIGGRGVDIKAAEIAGKGTFYRVRIPAGSKNDAVALCEKYRAAGGTCLVAK